MSFTVCIIVSSTKIEMSQKNRLIKLYTYPDLNFAYVLNRLCKKTIKMLIEFLVVHLNLLLKLCFTA
jgi:hypothetical protein